MKKIRQSDVARQAGVSLTAVSRVVNQSGYVAEDVRIRVERAIAELGYVPTAHSFVQRRCVIGLILPYALLNPYFEKLEASLHQACLQMGFDTVFAKSERITNGTLIPLVKKLSALNICGIVIATFMDDHLEQTCRDVLNTCGLPIVFIERTADCYGFNRVIVDNRLGTHVATSHLVEAGHTHLLYINKTSTSEAEEERLRGFMDVIAGTNGRVQGIVHNCIGQSPRDAYIEVNKAFLNDPDITGILAWNDMYALGAMLCVSQQGKKIPDDVEIIGYDDILAPTLEPPLSSVHMPIEEIASVTVEILAKSHNSTRLVATRSVSLEPRLVLR